MSHVRLFGHYIHFPFIILGLIDFLLLVISFSSACFYRFFGEADFFWSNFGYVLPSAIVFALINVIVMVALGVQQSRLEDGVAGMMLRTLASFFVSLPVAGFFYLLLSDKLWYLGNLDTLSAACVLGLLLLGIGRSLFFWSFGEDFFRKKVLVLGAGERARQISEDLDSPLNRKGFLLKGFVAINGETVKVPSEQLVVPGTSLHDYISTHPVHEIVVAVDDRRQNLPMEDLLECKMRGIPILEGAAFYEREARKVAMEQITPGWLVFTEGFSVSTVSGLGKRAIDLLAALTLFLLAAPIMLVTALIIKIEDGFSAPVLYSQERVGLNGKVFKVHKFRSMITDAEKNGAVWAQKNDTRVTKVGAFIRKVRIDELPQIFNVLSGSMAFVGPRPERPVFVQQLSETIPFYNERHRVKPGITGWAQLCFAYADNEEDTKEKLRYDLYYIKNQSLLLDLLIIIQTVEVILFKKGSR